jgi:dephospho-CoA kinase
LITVGLTGGIGSGKSTVSNMLREKNIPIVDADIIAREILELYPDLIKKIEETFGKEFFNEEGKLRRRELGNYIFKDKILIDKLENIMIPYIKLEIFRRMENFSELGEKLCIVDAPTLIEHSIHENMNANILVWVDEDTQIQRVIKRDSMEKEQVYNRINAQIPLESKKEKVDFIIDNSGSLKETKDQVERILVKISTLGEEK